jgi:hypothetical protein
VLQLAGRVGFGVDVGDFLELERTFHRHRVLRATAEEQGVVLVGEQLGDFLDGASMARASPRRVGRRRSSSTSSASTPASSVPRTWPRARVSSISDTSWVVKALVEATPISGRPGQQGQVGLTHQRADAHVADRQAAEEAQLLGVAQRGQGVGGFAGLRDGDEQVSGCTTTLR